jgi:hypothetical protein
MLGLFNDYRLRRPALAKACSCPRGRIGLDVKPTGERSAGNPLSTFEVAGSGNRFKVRLVSPIPEETGSPR